MAAQPDPPRRPATLCVHGDERIGEPRRPLAPPLVRASTFVLDEQAYALRAAGKLDEALCYSREHNPTVGAVERKLARLEGAERALLCASGQAALHALLLSTLERGEHVLAARELYGGTLSLLGELLPKLGVECTLVPLAELDAWRAAARGSTRLLLAESLSNPTLLAADVPALAELARARGARLAIDATFATPLVQRPLELGAHAVWHSATKFLGGHSDLVAGLLCGDAALLERAHGWRTKTGGCLDAEPAWLLERGLATLPLRMHAQQQNALVIAHFLSAHPRVRRVLHPSLEGHPTRAVAQRVLRGYGGLVSFEHAAGDAGAQACVRRLALFAEAASLGGVHSLASLPARMSHVALSAEQRRAAGIEPGLVRLSIGIEDESDLIDDLMQALG